jgi:glycosyltransferase involved in cell wall biosynthesis
MKILVAIPWLPWPLDSGGNVAVFNSLACLQRDHEFTLVCPVYGEDGVQGAAALQAHLPEVRVRGVDCGSVAHVKRPGRRLIIRTLRRAARFCPKLISAKPLSVTAEPGEDVPEYPFDPLPARFVSAVLAELQTGFDFVQLEFAQMLSLGACLPTDVPKLFVHHQLQFVYLQRRAAVRSYVGYARYLEQMTLLQEKAYLRTFDGVVVFSEEDARRLRQWVPDEKIFVSPFPVIGGPTERDGGDADVHLLFVGSEGHFPNRDGLEWLLTEVWPHVLSELPNCKLRVIGRWREGTMAHLSAVGVEFAGFVPDLAASLKGGVMLVPIRIGSGIRVKVLDAMSHGVPVISTSVGCEGIPASDECEILIRDDSKEFADAVVRLAKSRELRERLANAGRGLVSRVYSPERVRRERDEIYRLMLSRRRDWLCASAQGD